MFTCCGIATSLVASWIAMVTAWVALDWCSEAMTSHFSRACTHRTYTYLLVIHSNQVGKMFYPGEPFAKFSPALLG